MKQRNSVDCTVRNLLVACICAAACLPGVCASTATSSETEGLSVFTDFPGGSAQVDRLDEASRVIEIRPGSDPLRGWLCWWCCGIRGLDVGEVLTFRITGMDFALPVRASCSTDRKKWLQTERGSLYRSTMTYRIAAPAETFYLAWGPPYQLADAQAAVQRVADASVGAEAFELCRSSTGKPVPALRWSASSESDPRASGVWIQARQHAWECGSSWVCQGLMDWLASEDELAKKLRDRVTIYVVPVMDVDNVERGAGGKDQHPHDHNRDWSANPNWPEVAAVQKYLKQLDENGGLDLFLDIHNADPRTRFTFFCTSSNALLSQNRYNSNLAFIRIAQRELATEPIGVGTRILPLGPSYTRQWRTVSNNWLAWNTHQHVAALTLEVAWNQPPCNQANYQRYGAAVGKCVAAFALARTTGAR